MPRHWLAALGAFAVIACGDDNSGGGPNDVFPDVAGVYAVEGTFDGFTPEEASFTGSVTIEQESVELSTLGGTADLLLTAEAGNLVLNDIELQDATVTLSGVVEFTVTSSADNVTWTFSGERAGDVLEGDHTLTQGSTSQSGPWSGQR